MRIWVEKKISSVQFIDFIAVGFTFWQNCVGYKVNFTKAREFSILFLKLDNLCQQGAKGENVFLLMKD